MKRYKDLADKTWGRVTAGDAELGENIAAYTITNAIKLKRKFGMGSKKPSISLNNIVKMASKIMIPGKCAKKVIKSALKAAREAVKKAGGKSNIIVPRALAVPAKVGGFLPFLIPVFAGLSATGALAGGSAGIAKAVNDAKAAKLQLTKQAAKLQLIKQAAKLQLIKQAAKLQLIKQAAKLQLSSKLDVELVMEANDHSSTSSQSSNTSKHSIPRKLRIKNPRSWWRITCAFFCCMRKNNNGRSFEHSDSG